MLDQNTDRMWYVIGAVIIGAAIILIMNKTFPQLFASVGDTYKEKTEQMTEVVDGIGPVKPKENLMEYSTQGNFADPEYYYYQPIIGVEDGKEALAYSRSDNILMLGFSEYSLENGRTYKFSFYAKSSENLNLKNVYINGKNSYYLANTTITTKWTNYTFTFTARGNDTIHAHMYPEMAQADGKNKIFYITDWRLEFAD